MGMNNTYDRKVLANPALKNPNQPNIKEYDGAAALMNNFTELGDKLLNVYAKADYEAAGRDMKEDLSNRSMDQADALRRANLIAEPRARKAFYDKEMAKINKKYGQNIDGRFAEDYKTAVALDDKKAELDLTFNITKDIQSENRVRAKRDRDLIAEKAAGADPAYIAELDNRVKKDLDSMLANGSISQFEHQLEWDEYEKKKRAAQLDYFASSAPDEWNDEQISTTLDNMLTGVKDENEKKMLKEYATSKIKSIREQNEYLNTFNQLSDEYDLFNVSYSQNLSLAQISARMPKNATKEYQQLIKGLNGYGKAMKLDDSQKAIIQQNFYDELAEITAKPNATPKDFQQLQNKMFKAMSVGAITKADGKKVFDEILMPLNNAWAMQMDKLTVDAPGLFSGDIGLKEVKNYLDKEKSADIQRIEEKFNKGKKLSKDESTAYTNHIRTKVRYYQAYYDNLKEVLRANGINSVDDVDKLSESKKRAIFQNAQDITTRYFNAQKYRELLNLTPEKQPNAIADGSKLVRNTGNIENSKQGTPIKQTGVFNVGKYKVEIVND